MRTLALCLLLASAGVLSAFGPEEKNSDYCSAEGCEGGQGFSAAKNSMRSSSNSATKDERDGGHDLEIVGDSWQIVNILHSIGSYMEGAWTTVKHNVQNTNAYKKVTEFADQTTQFVKITIEKTTEYFEDIRSAIREEFYKLMEVMWERSMGALFSEPGELKVFQ